MSRNTQMHRLETIFPPFTNRNIEDLRNKANVRIQEHLRKSKFYMIGGRAETNFVNFNVDFESAKIYVEIEVGAEIIDGGVIHVKKIPEITSGKFPIIHTTPQAILLEDERRSVTISWITPDSLYWNKARGADYLEGFNNAHKVCTYDLLYVGISTGQDAYKRLIKNAHHARLDILSREPQRKKGAHLSDEIILFLYEIDMLGIQVFNHEDDNFDFLVPHSEKIVKDCEKAFVKILGPNYNEVKFREYPKGKDGLFDQGLDAYSYSLNESFVFKTSVGSFTGHYSEMGFDNRSDFISIEGEEVTLVIAKDMVASG